MKYFSTFSGIGGFELGITQAYEQLCNAERSENRGSKKNTESYEEQGLLTEKGENTCTEERPVSERLTDRINERPLCIGYSEIDKYATQIYQSHFPEHKNYGDITKIKAEDLPEFDLIVGGFPCQSFSIAGKRGGFADTRGTLFFDIARIIKAKQPRLLLLENVKGLLSHDKGDTFRVIISTLDELGYDIQWQVLNSKNFGVPQNRERVFIVGHIRGSSRPEVFPFGEASSKDIEQLNKPRHSNDRVYSIDGISPTLNTMQGGNRQPFIRIQEATKKGYAEATVGQSINLSVPNSKTRRGRVSDIAQTLDTGMQQHTLTNDMRIRRLTPTECERLQGFPDGWTEGVSDTQRYKTLGNGVTVNVVEAIISKLI
jgi:DNA (cytosine-5)-methyltransferase 1